MISAAGGFEMIVRSAAFVAAIFAFALPGAPAAAYDIGKTGPAKPLQKAEHAEGAHDEGGHAGHGSHVQRLHGEPQPEDSIAWDPYLFFFTLVLFLVMLYLLNQYAWQPILKNMEEREQRVDEIIRQAEIANEDLQRLKLEMDKSLAASHEEIRKTLDQVRADASKEAEEMLTRAKEEAAADRARALAAVETTKKDAQESLREASLELAMKMAGKFVDRPLNPAMVRQHADGGTR